MTATFPTTLPRIGDVIDVAPGIDPRWKRAFRMRVTEVITHGSGKRLAAPIIGGILRNADGTDRKAHAERAIEYRADLVTLAWAADPSAVDLNQAYARQAKWLQAEASGGAPCGNRDPHRAHTWSNSHPSVAHPVEYRCAGVPVSAETDAAALVGRMRANAGLSSAETHAAVAPLAGERVTLHRIIRYDQVIDEGEITYRPVISSLVGGIGAVTHRAQTVTVTLLSADEMSCQHVTLVGRNHPMGHATPYAIDVHQAEASVPVAEAGDQAEPVMIQYPADVMSEARTLRMGDRVSGATSGRKPFAGYLCADPTDGRDQAGNPAVVIMLGPAPVEGTGDRWCITGTARFTRLPADPGVVAEGETLTAMRAMRRAGYTVTGARCTDLTAHHAHIYSRDDAPARTRFACRGLVVALVEAPDAGAEEMRAASATVAARDAVDQGATPASLVSLPADVGPDAYPAGTRVTVGARTGVVDSSAEDVILNVTWDGSAVSVEVLADDVTVITPEAAPVPVPPVATVAAVTTESEAPMPAPAPTEATEAAPVPAGHLVATINRADLVEAFTYVTRFIPAKTALPAYAAVVLTTATADQVTMSCDAFDAAMTVQLPADVAATGTVMINARELSGLVKATPAPKGKGAAPTLVTIAHQGDRVTVTAGASAFSAPVVTSTAQLAPVPVVPETPIMLADADAFAATVNRVTPAAGTDDTFPHLMCVQMTTTREGDRLLMLATNRERAAEAGLPVAYGLDADTDAREHLTPGLVLAKPLALVATVAAKTAGTTVDVTAFAHRGDQWHGYRVGRYAFALRMIAGELPPIARMFDTPRASTVVTDASAFGALVKRVSLAGQKSDPLRVTVAADQAGEVTGITVDLIAGSRVVATETMAATGRASDGYTVAFTHHYLSTALAGVTGDATMATDPGTRHPAVTVAGTGADGYRALIQSRRIDGPTLPMAAPVPDPAMAAPVVDPVDVHTADEIEAAGTALVRVHGRNGNGQPLTLAGTVRNVTRCLTGRVAGQVRVLLDSGRTIYVSVTATPKGDVMSATDQTTDQTTDQRNAAEKLAHRAFTLMTGGQFADARTAMAEAAALVPASHKYGRKHELSAVLAMIDAAEAAAAPAPAMPVVAESTGVELSPIAIGVTPDETTGTDAGTDTDAAMAATVRDILSRVTWSGAKVDGRSVDIASLPSGVRRDAYLAVKAVVAPMGGGWSKKTATRPAGFAFAAPVVAWGTGGFTMSGREKISAWLADGTVAVDQAPADVPAAAPAAPAQTPDTAPAAPAPADTPAEAGSSLEDAYAAGYAAALAALTGQSATPTAAPTAAPTAPAEPSVHGYTYTLPDFKISGEVYGASVAAITAAIAAAGHSGVTVKRVARTGADRRKFTVKAPAATSEAVRAIAAAYVKGLNRASVA